MSHGFRTSLLAALLVVGWNASAQEESENTPEVTETAVPSPTDPVPPKVIPPPPDQDDASSAVPEPKPPPPKPAKKAAAAAPLAPPAAAPALPAPSGPAKPLEGKTVLVERQARYFFEALLAGNATAAVSFCNFPFMLEDRTFKTTAELTSELGKQLQNKRTDLLTLGPIEVLPPADAEKKYGKPPARLNRFPYKTSGAYVVVARLSGHAAVAIFQESGNTFQAIAYHD